MKKLILAVTIIIGAGIAFVTVNEHRKSTAYLAWVKSHPVGHTEEPDHRTARFALEAQRELSNECAKTVGFRRIVDCGIYPTNATYPIDIHVSGAAPFRVRLHTDVGGLGAHPETWCGWADVEFVNAVGGVQLTNLPFSFSVPLRDMEPDYWRVACRLDYYEIGQRELEAREERTGLSRHDAPVRKP